MTSPIASAHTAAAPFAGSATLGIQSAGAFWRAFCYWFFWCFSFYRSAPGAGTETRTVAL